MSTELVRVCHPYTSWEDWKHGAWRNITAAERRELLPIAVAFTGNAELYGSYMMRVANEWPIACEHNLTDRQMNRLAWIGHAAACMAHAIPEDVTREAWRMLTDEQRMQADRKASDAVEYWEQKRASENTQLYLFMEEARVSC